MNKTVSVTSEAAGQRLDLFCVAQLGEISRGLVQRAIKEGSITVNGERQKPRYVVKERDQVQISLAVSVPDVALEVAPVSFPILYEDKDVVVIDKPAGVTVHRGVGQTNGTVVDWFVQRYPGVAEVGEGEFRAGIVHRLDKDTSGVLILAKTPQAHAHLKKQFQHRRAKKEYLALVFGVPGGDDGRINQPLLRSKRNPLRRTIDREGKAAITEWKLEEKFGDDYALLRVFPFTGRTHQIRVHLHWLGYPIVGDQLYTFKRQRPPHGVLRHLLHAEQLTITLPSKQRKTFTAPLPSDFADVLDSLR